MFNACRRGPASISKVLRASSTSLRTASVRPSTLSLVSRTTVKAVQEPRWIHISSALRAFESAKQKPHQGNQQHDQGPRITKFEELKDMELVHPNIVDTITRRMGLETMTDVQTATITQALRGNDM